MVLKVAKESKKENIIETIKRRRGYEKFCDMLSCMTNEELKSLGLKKCKKLDNPNLTSVERARIYGEIAKITQEYNGSSDIQEYEKLSDEDKKKTLEAVFSNKKGDLKLRIPVGSLMELRDILEEYATQELSDDEV